METPVSTITSTGDLGGQKVGMEIDSSAMAHIMSILTDLYSDPQLAVIREYATNALDAHIEAGVTAPIEVITPSALSPYFKVIDHGVGLSVDDIVSMYSKYGASTKRGTNEQVGMLGLGAKSALTLVPQFNLTSVKNGVKIFVSISRNADGAGQMEIIDTRATDEPNGVEISIPVPRNHLFVEKIRNFFRFWKQGTVLIDGKEPEQITGRPVGDKFIINNKLGQDYVVMGNVAYPVKDGLWTEGYSHKGIVAYVGIGDVNFTPSREALHYTNKTKATIKALREEFSQNLLTSAVKDVDSSTTYGEAWIKAADWRSNFGRQFNNLVYKGVRVPSDIGFDTYTVPGQTNGYNRNPYSKTVEGKVYSLTGLSGRYTSNLRSVTPSMVDEYLFVINFADSLKMSPVQREKAAIYATQNNLKATKVAVFNKPAFISDKDMLKFLDGINIVDWKDIAKIKVERNVSTNRIIRTDPYDMFDGTYGHTQVRTLDTSKPIIYYSSAELSYPAWLKELFPDAQLIILSKNRWEKFARDWPTAKHYVTVIKEHADALVKTFTYADRVLWHHGSDRYQVQHLDAKQINDPDLAAYVSVLQGQPQYSDAAKKVRNLLNKGVNVDIEVPDNPLTKYPLLGSIGRSNAEHGYWYLNTFYASLTNNKEN